MPPCTSRSCAWVSHRITNSLQVMLQLIGVAGVDAAMHIKILRICESPD
jgi:hypothetical protein